MRSAAQRASLSAWHPLHALGVPRESERSGRGTRTAWSRRACTTMYVRVGMWQSTQAEPGFPSSWKWWAGVANVSRRWQFAHASAAPPVRAREAWPWQSKHPTPAACIFVCSHEPCSKTSACTCPSGK